MAIIGYARVSGKGQSTDIQQADLKALGCDRIYFEQQSGSTTNGRKQLKEMLDYAREGDTVVIMKLDRLARNTVDALTIIEDLTNKNIHIKIMDIGEGQDLTNGVGKLLLTVMAAVAEMERERINERTARGRDAARVRGVKFGRKPTGKAAEILKLHSEGVGSTAIAKELEISRQTVYRYVKASES